MSYSYDRRAALSEAFDSRRVRKIQKEAEKVLSNWDKIQTEEDFKRYQKGIIPWRNKLREDHKALIRYLRDMAVSDSSVKNVDRQIDIWAKKIKPLWEVSNSVDLYPSIWEYWAPRRKEWRDKLKKAVDSLSGVAKWLDNLARSRKIRPSTPDITPRNMNLSGFDVQLLGFDPSDDKHISALGKLEKGLSTFKQKASRAMPSMTKRMVPIRAHFDEDSLLGKQGQYGDGLLYLYPLNIKKVSDFVYTVIHELAHHFGLSLLSSEAQGKWNHLFRSDFQKLDLKSALDTWPVGMTPWDWEAKIKKSHPALYLQLQSLQFGHIPAPQGLLEALTDRDKLEAYIADGKSSVDVPATPTTGYGATNPHEAFAEAIALLVAYGPRAVDPKILSWLKIVMPGEIRLATKIFS